ncbi:MAG: glycosyltransferase family 39 protein [Armatimonadetes bacterium]|nr:glycosyltransferase family 39 protein [Armatimonadota bacterium]
MTRHERLALVGIVALALALRLGGLAWGVPNGIHLKSYHPDEWSTVDTALRMVVSGEHNPRFFNYPSLTIYLVYGFLKLVSLILAPSGDSLGLWYVLARLVTVALGTAGVALVFGLGRRLVSPRFGLAAAGCLAVLPLAVVNSHFATVDVPLTTWCALALWAAVELAGPGASRRWLWIGAVACGLAAGTKYNGVLVLLPLLLGLWLGRRPAVEAVAAVGLAALVFVATSPFVFIDPQAWAQIRFELIEHPRASNLFVGVGPGWWFHLRDNLPTAAGTLLALAATVGLARLARRREAWPLLLWAALCLLAMGRTKELFIRYWLPLLPVLALAAAEAVRAAPQRWRAAVLLALLLGPGLRSRALVAMMAGDDARDRAAAWCAANIPGGESVGEIERTWFWSVPLRPNNSGHPVPGPADGSRWDLRSDPDAWPADPPRWLAVNETKRLERYHAEPQRWAALTRDYERVVSFANRATILPGWRETGLGRRQHDWLYLLPSIDIYRRR